MTSTASGRQHQSNLFVQQLVLLLALAVALTACTSDEPAEPPTTDSGSETGLSDDEFHLVNSGETLTQISRDWCGSSNSDLLWHLVDINSSNQQPDGEFLVDINNIEAGWVLEIDCEVPLPPLIECPTTASTAFVGSDDSVRVALCNTDGRTEYFGQRLSDRSSIVLSACRADNGSVQAVNSSADTDTYYIVDPDGTAAPGNSPRLEIRQVGSGLPPTEDADPSSFNLEPQVISQGGYRPCETAEPEPIEDEETYALDLAPMTSIAFDTEKQIAEGELCNEMSLATTTQPSVILGIIEADATTWVTIRQGTWLRLDIPDYDSDAELVGGGLSWTIEQAFGVHALEITDAQPPGRYKVVDNSGELLARVEVVPADELSVVRDQQGSTDRLYLYRVYDISSARASIMVREQLGCDGFRWNTHQEIAVVGTSNSGVAKLSVDFNGAPTDEEFCLAIDSVCHSSIFFRP